MSSVETEKNQTFTALSYLRAASAIRANPITMITTTACCSRNIAHLGREQEEKCSRRKFHGVMLFDDLCEIDMCFWIIQRFWWDQQFVVSILFWWSVALDHASSIMMSFDHDVHNQDQSLSWGLDFLDLFVLFFLFSLRQQCPTWRQRIYQVLMWTFLRS